nr:immunoglobulin heavy chain junction region [Mus musculus]
CTRRYYGSDYGWYFDVW